MASVTYVEADGSARTVDLPAGESVMRGALDNAVEGIAGECGGGLACATCRCFVDEAWVDRVGAPSLVETEMLECTAVPARANSRLSCQIFADDTLDGLVVHLPEAQY